MAYTIPTTIAVGDPVKKDTYDKLKGNDIDHETRILALEASTGAIVIIDENIFNIGQYKDYPTSLEGLIHFQAKQNMTLTSAIVTDLVGSTSGSTEIDILKSSSIGGSYSTIFSTKPSVSSASPAESSNAVFSVTSVSSGEWLRLDITSIAVGAKSINVALVATQA